MPTYYASQGYDTALAIAAALKATSGNVRMPRRSAPRCSRRISSRCAAPSSSAPNQHPVQDWYSLQVEKGADGKPVLKTVGKVLSNHGDVYAKDCKLWQQGAGYSLRFPRRI